MRFTTGLGVAAFAAGMAIGAYSLAMLREPLPQQVQPLCSPLECASLAKDENPVSSQEVQLDPTKSKAVVHYLSQPDIGDRIGTITLPTLDLSWPIFEGTQDEQLAMGVGHYVGSVLPGMDDNSILSGHRTGVFNRLGELELNDLILVQTELGTFTYQVRGFEIVDRSDQTVIGPTPSAVLTLTTCYPFNSLTSTTEAFIVEADLVSTSLKPDRVPLP